MYKYSKDKHNFLIVRTKPWSQGGPFYKEIHTIASGIYPKKILQRKPTFRLKNQIFPDKSKISYSKGQFLIRAKVSWTYVNWYSSYKTSYLSNKVFVPYLKEFFLKEERLKKMKKWNV